MKFLLDTNAVIALIKRDATFLARLKLFKPSDFAIPSVVMFELYYGAAKSQKVAENLAILEKLPFEVLPFDQPSAVMAGKIRAELAQKGTPIGPYDVMIAGLAMAHQLTLITHNVKEFERVAGLQFENWL